MHYKDAPKTPRPRKPPGQGKKKPNKEQREKKRAELADLYNEAFNHGFSVGHNQGFKDGWEANQRNVLKYAHRGR